MQITKEEFLKALEQAGFSEVVTVTREGNTGLGDHRHPFEAKALVLEGSIRIECAGVAHEYQAGEVFHLQQDALHSESYGPQGVVYLVGRKTSRAS
jgi:quercetin dioxygenase-like cupin family protein